MAKVYWARIGRSGHPNQVVVCDDGSIWLQGEHLLAPADAELIGPVDDASYKLRSDNPDADGSARDGGDRTA